jgi:hypothetical protein
MISAIFAQIGAKEEYTQHSGKLYDPSLRSEEHQRGPSSATEPKGRKVML